MLIFIILIPILNGYTVKVSEKAFAPAEIHDKCDKTELTDLYMKCQMKNTSMECSSTSCGGEKFRCNCNVHRLFFVFYDETKCRWEHEHQESCTISSSTATTSSTTTTTTAITTTTTTTITTTTLTSGRVL